MVELRRVLAAVSFAAALVASPRSAEAQLHWDASVQIGAMKRLLAERPAGTDDAGIGPVAQLTGHVALLPLVHLGAYLGHDISPLPGDAASRRITWGGMRVKSAIPLSTRVMGWAFAGFGYAGTYAPGYRTTLGAETGRTDASVQDAGGGFFDVPFGIGASYKLQKPWRLCAELGGRFGFGHSGSVYEDPGPQVKLAGSPDQNVLPSGLDRFAVGLTVGVMLER